MNNNHTTPPSLYIPEIDGLRAIAVLSVVFFHAFETPGSGYMGVDIFFVISGYLITFLLLKEYRNTGTLNFWKFYSRRAKRILPALLVVLFASFSLSLAVLPNDNTLLLVSELTASGLLFVSNFYLEAFTGGYFDQSSDSNPLLHLWSLSVEEQYYLIWPLLFLLAVKFKHPILTTIGLTLISFSIAEFFVEFEPSIAFYYMPTRFWELSLGGLVALLPQRRLIPLPLVGEIGLLIVFLAIFLPTVKFPGSGAALVVIGSTLLILALHTQQSGFVLQKALANRISRLFGLTSYSLYLWHWPLLALYNATNAGAPENKAIVIILTIAFIFSLLSYRYVEQPIRNLKTPHGNRRLVLSSLIFSLLLALISLIIGNQLYQPQRSLLPHEIAASDWPQSRLRCNYRGFDDLSDFPRKACILQEGIESEVIIWGDSMALSWIPFAETIAAQTGSKLIAHTRDACPPILSFDNGKRSRESNLCKSFNEKVFGSVKSADKLIYSALWGESPEYFKKIHSTLIQVAPFFKEIIVLGPTPRLKDDVPKCMKLDDLESCDIPISDFTPRRDTVRNQFASIANRIQNVTYVDPTHFFCRETLCSATKDGYSLYWDSHHISSTAARAFAVTYTKSVAKQQ